MDSRNNYTQSSSYVGLLYSQQGSSVQHENFPYESFHSSVHLGESENPPFSSQQSEDTPVGTPVGTPVSTPVDRVVRHKWTPADDEVLISAWLNTSKDAVVGSQQNSLTFWQRVAEYYAASPHGGEEGEKREHLHCKKRQISSGESDTDVLKRAHDIFYADHRTKFSLEHAWCVLRYKQKWLSLNTPKASSKRKNGETTAETSTTENGYHETRPEGIKAGKSKRNTAQGYGYSETDDLIRRDQEEINLQRGSPVQCPPEPEVEFGFPQRCYCGAQPLLATSSREIGRRYYTCANVNDGECHVWKWWDDALMEELRARNRHVLLLSEKVDSLALLSDYETEQMVYDLAKEKSKLSYGFEFFLGNTFNQEKMQPDGLVYLRSKNVPHQLDNWRMVVGLIQLTNMSDLVKQQLENYHLAYYLTDCIYPKLATFIQSIRLPQGQKNSLFAQTQEAVRKDVERAFGVLQARFAIVRNPSHLWDKDKIANIMRACIILHNMIVEDERSSSTQYDVDEFQEREEVDTFSVNMPSNLVRDKTLETLSGHVDYSFASAWHPDGTTSSTGNQDTRNLSQSLAVLKGNLGAIRSIRYTSNGKYMAMAEPADFVHVYLKGVQAVYIKSCFSGGTDWIRTYMVVCLNWTQVLSRNLSVKDPLGHGDAFN
uniref:No apical meristem-associated C-terminal domain-containing protein n=1 Tax=Brassica oleracea TaxID=3712 RepID=A0A3P6GFC9_BRAOL|nr:unnamed protein product [Brassica oleracea]